MNRERRAFSLVEAMVGVAIMAMAGTVLLLSVEATLHTASNVEDETIAAGIANQLVDEILGQRYADSPSFDPYEYPLGPDNWKRAGQGRRRFRATGDYNGYSARPAEDMWGVEMGRGDGEGGLRPPEFQVPADRFDRWKQETDVYYVDESDPSRRLSGSQTSHFRCLEVRILREEANGHWRPLAIVKRVFAYVPPPP